MLSLGPPAMRWSLALPLAGDAPLILAGHYHRREQHTLPGGTLLFMQGSTGASGLRGLEHEKPTPARLSPCHPLPN